MADFDPDAYLADQSGPPSPAQDNFDPDAYLNGSNSLSDAGNDHADQSRDTGPAPEGPLARGVRNIAHGVAPAVGGYVGAGAGAEAGAAIGALAGPFGAGAGAIVGGLVGAFGGGYAAEKVADTVQDAVGGDDRAQMEANRQAHPIESTIEGAIPAFAGMRFDKGATILARGVSSAMQGGIEGAQEYANEGNIDPGKIAAIAALGAVFPSTNKLGEKLVGAGQRMVPGRPGRTANPTADQAHVDVGDQSVETAVGDSVLAESPPGPQGLTTGNPQSAPERSERDYKKGAPAAEDQSQVTTGDMDPATKAALAEANPETPQAPEAAQPQPPTGAPPQAPANINAQKPRLALKRPPEPSVEAGFPQPGEPVATGANDVTPLPEGQTARTAAAIAKSKEPSLAKLFGIDEPKEIKGENNKKPTDDQGEAGNYLKARSGAEFGKNTAWETRAGDIRRSRSDAPEPWEHESPYDYGYFNKTKSTDGEGIDRAQPVAGTPESGDKHFIIDQKNPETGKYDEPKVFTFVKDKAAAIDLYNRGFGDGKGPDRMHDISEVSKDDLTKYLLKHSTKGPTKPYGKPMEGRVLKVGPDQPGLTAEAAAAKTERNHGNFPVEGLLNDQGKPVTANTKARAADRAQAHKNVQDWFEKSAPKKENETPKELIERLLGAGIAARSAKNEWQPTFKPKEWLLAREAMKLKAVPTKGSMKKFYDAERLLRGTDEDVQNYRGGNRVEADIAQSRRSGDEAIAAHENEEGRSGVNEEETKVLEGIERSKRGEGDFDVPHEEAEEMVKPQKVTGREGLKALPHKTVDVRDSALVKDVGPLKKDEASLARAREANALKGAKSEKPALKEQPVRNGLADADPEYLKHLVELSNKTAKRKALDEDAIAIYNTKADQDRSPTSNLFDQLWKNEEGAVGNKNPRLAAAQAALKTTPVKSYIARTPKAGEKMADYTRSVSDELHQLDNRNTAHKNNIQDWLGTLPKEADRAALERIYKAREKDSAHFPLPAGKTGTHLDNLSPADKKIWDEHLADKVAEINDFKDTIRKLDPDLMGPDVEHYIARITKGDTSEYNLLKASDDPTQPVNGIKVNAGMAKERAFSALERVSDGRRFVTQNLGEGNGFRLWDKYKGSKIKDPNYAFEANKPYTVTDKNGGTHDYIMREATSDEIQAHARGADGKGKPMKYYQNAGLSVAMAHAQLGTMARNLVELARMSSTPEFKKMTAPVGSKKAEELDWKASKLPNYRGVAMDPQLRYVFDDYAKSGFDTPQLLRQLNQQVTKLLFWMPTAHIANVAAHWFVGRGFDNLNVTRLFSTGARAIKSVMSQDITQKRLLDAGSSLIYPTVRNRNFIEKVAKGVGEEFVRDPSTWGPIADKLGVPLKKLSDAIYSGSSKVMWAANDVFMTQRVLELESKGHSTDQAIKMAERDIPNYRIPTTLMGSGEKARLLSQFMSDPTYTAFGRYHVGMFTSYANIVKDAVHGNTGDRVEAIGKMMALGVLAYVVYPTLDKLAKTVTGNEEASQNRRGPMGVPSHVGKALEGKEDVMSAMRSTVTVPPLWTTVLETLFNKDWRGKSIVEPGTMQRGAYGKAAVQEGEHALRGLVSPYSTFAGAEKKGNEEGASGVAKSTARAIRDQATDEKNPSDAAIKFAAHQEKYNRQNEKSRDKRGGYGPLEELFGKASPGR